MSGSCRQWGLGGTRASAGGSTPGEGVQDIGWREHSLEAGAGRWQEGALPGGGAGPRLEGALPGAGSAPSSPPPSLFWGAARCRQGRGGAHLRQQRQHSVRE